MVEGISGKIKDSSQYETTWTLYTTNTTPYSMFKKFGSDANWKGAAYLNKTPLVSDACYRVARKMAQFLLNLLT